MPISLQTNLNFLNIFEKKAKSKKVVIGIRDIIRTTKTENRLFPKDEIGLATNPNFNSQLFKSILKKIFQAKILTESLIKYGIVIKNKKRIFHFKLLRFIK